MSENFKTVSEIFTGEITEKKSRFIATLAPVSTEEEALEFIKEMKKKYWDARHNCSAYILGTTGQRMHSSDDGEPSGTAGKPILNVLAGNKLYNVICVVTRYFGGTLLGTGGLVRAYSGAVEECLKNADLKEMVYGSHIRISASYNDIGKLQYIFAQNEAVILSSEYTDSVTFNILIANEKEDMLLKAISEATQNKSVSEIITRDFFPM